MELGLRGILTSQVSKLAWNPGIIVQGQFWVPDFSGESVALRRNWISAAVLLQLSLSRPSSKSRRALHVGESCGARVQVWWLQNQGYQGHYELCKQP